MVIVYWVLLLSKVLVSLWVEHAARMIENSCVEDIRKDAFLYHAFNYGGVSIISRMYRDLELYSTSTATVVYWCSIGCAVFATSTTFAKFVVLSFTAASVASITNVAFTDYVFLADFATIRLNSLMSSHRTLQRP